MYTGTDLLWIWVQVTGWRGQKKKVHKQILGLDNEGKAAASATML